ncbi:MAG TPA: copper resistance protein CopC [Acidocella sp.]|jgi:methionine-rich copper-binding protein CopC|uniref:copper resistance CopC family protein n=1 Tax=Acidocella sp. TaxID=50710 RepID=UPI002C127A5E|nr:copper resistance protein CopC [Acidocella sp.]HVE21195.1 copper resistance protein CopC [Acidocella sp.]
MKLFTASVLLASLAGLSPAFAHAFLLKADPGVGSIVATAPAQLLMTYTEGLEVPFCAVTVTSATGTVVNGKPQAVPGHRNEMSVPLHITAPGTYSVTWHAVAVDTHHTQGSFKFTVSP